jgi:hypothetical protein
MKTEHKILVCSTCASIWQDGKRVGISGGEKLLSRSAQIKLTGEGRHLSFVRDEKFEGLCAEEGSCPELSSGPCEPRVSSAPCTQGGVTRGNLASL